MRRLAIFIGGPLDGHRRELAELRPHVELLHAERTEARHLFGHPIDSKIETHKLSYLMASRPINPARDLARSRPYDGGILDSEIGIYHYVGSEQVTR